MKIFSCDINIKSSTLPIFKIILCILLIVLLIESGSFINIRNPYLNIFLSIASAALTVLAVFIIYLSVAELIMLNERKAVDEINVKAEQNYSETCSIDSVVSLLRTNSIIEFAVVSGDQIVRIGASSDCDVSDCHFFDKEYYIDDASGFTIEELEKELVKYLIDGKLHVVSIDGILPSYYIQSDIKTGDGSPS